MLSYLVRTIPVIVRATRNRDGRLVSRLERRVRFGEIDPNLHMNQAVYARVAEYGRTDWVIRSQAWQRWRSEGIKPVVAEQHIVYRRELRAGTRYLVDTRATAVDGRLLRVESVLLVGDRVHARDDTKLIFIGRDGVLAADAVQACCAGLLSEPLAIEAWQVVGAG
ncbi:MAG: acyl-CoA thioesterase [Myxococcales bacterium]|nr:acyl-CoA thioesterase [Myxococcales bacterium]